VYFLEAFAVVSNDNLTEKQDIVNTLKAIAGIGKEM